MVCIAEATSCGVWGLQAVVDGAKEQEDKMKSHLVSKYTCNCAAATAILIVAGSSMSYGSNPRHARHEAKRERNGMSALLMAPREKRTDASYQPPRSPGFNEDFGG